MVVAEWCCRVSCPCCCCGRWCSGERGEELGLVKKAHGLKEGGLAGVGRGAWMMEVSGAAVVPWLQGRERGCHGGGLAMLVAADGEREEGCGWSCWDWERLV